MKHAAVRKLFQELGIPPEQLDVSKFQFLTRLHYWAADTVTHGKQAPWGEHEIDYVLFYAVDSKDQLTIQPHPEEVDDYKWVSVDDLKSMLLDKSLLFSPWFRLITQRWLYTWWDDLEVCLQPMNKHCDYVNIHCFDPPTEHWGGAGNAKPLFIVGDSSKKQGAYGKVVTHKESKIKQLMHIDEVWSAFTVLFLNPLKSNLDSKYIQESYDKDALAFCNDILVKVSRSFAAVIQQLPSHVLVDILVFYLVLRALDTIEDDTSNFESNQIKIAHLQKFHKTALLDPNWRMTGIGEGDERRLLESFPLCHKIYSTLPEQSRLIIADITERMANGMAEFVSKDLGQGTTDIQQYNLYCHFVAGLVGEGLSRLFAGSGLEKQEFAKEIRLSDQMGLFLQKTNIIRDYLEDYVDKRAFWPQSVWKKYSSNGDLGYFVNQNEVEVQRNAKACLNELVTDALELVPDCLRYMQKLECREIFRFCAIPQVMAIATLDKCYANLDVFSGVVKIRKGLSCKLILRTNTLTEVHETFYLFAKSILSTATRELSSGVEDPSHNRTVKICESIMSLTSNSMQLQTKKRLLGRTVALGLLGTAGYFWWYDRSQPKWLPSTLLGLAGISLRFAHTKPSSLLRTAESIKPLNKL